MKSFNDESIQSLSWHTLPVVEVFSGLESGASGLSKAEALDRLVKFGPNELQVMHRILPWKLFLEQFKNVLIIILLLATAISFFLGHRVESVTIFIIVLFAVLLGFVQEYRAERAIEALRKMAAPTATVLRDKEEFEIPARELVPGDIVFLRAGDKIPADLRLVETFNLQVEESVLTGESLPVEKSVVPLDKSDLILGDRKNMTYAGTVATYGRGSGVVVATGMNTEFGKIARMLQTVETSKTPLQDNLDRLGNVLLKVTFFIVAIIVILGLLRSQPLIEMLIFGIALAVAVVPEALPAVVTISLAIGVQRMVKRHALIRRLPAVETLGSTSIICTDKTGTLTKDEMTVRKIFVDGEMYDVTGTGYEPTGEFLHNGSPVELTDTLKILLTAGTLASDADIVYNEADGRWHIKGDPTEGALVVAASKAGLSKVELDGRLPRVHEIPFTSETKRMTTIHKGANGMVAYSKGAPEVILQSCRLQKSGKAEISIDAERRKKILKEAHQMASEALRVLAVAYKPLVAMENAEEDMIFLGLVGMIDPPRPEAKNAVQTCKEAGIKVVMITGDHPVTALSVAGEIGLLKTGRIVTGAELEKMSDAELEREVEKIEVYARVSPVHKLRVVTALQKRGQIAAMTGDGVNDAPALKKADIGIAMGITGTDVTKEAAAMTLTDDNFASIVAAVEEGRGIFGNIKKYLMYLLSSNIGEICLMAAATIFGLPLPLTAVQILYVNLATDGLPAIALAVDPPESDLMRRPPRDPRKGIFTRSVVTLMMTAGLWSGAINLMLFIWAMRSGRSIYEAMTMTFISLVLIQFFNAYNFRSDYYSIFNHPFANKWLNLSILWGVASLFLVVYVPFLNRPFGTFPLTPIDWAIITTVAFTIVPVVELAKLLKRFVCV
jgi:Ca2+-transporting ATPase